MGLRYACYGCIRSGIAALSRRMAQREGVLAVGGLILQVPEALEHLAKVPGAGTVLSGFAAPFAAHPLGATAASLAGVLSLTGAYRTVLKRHRSLFSLKSAKVELTFPEGTLSRAHLRKQYEFTVSQKGITRWVHRDIRADGQVPPTSIKWNGVTLPPGKLRGVGGSMITATVDFDAPLATGRLHQGVLEYDALNAFHPDQTEELEYRVRFPCRRIEFDIRLPRPITGSVAVRIRRGGQEQEEEVPKVVRGQHPQITYASTSVPGPGSEIVVDWQW